MLEIKHHLLITERVSELSSLPRQKLAACPPTLYRPSYLGPKRTLHAGHVSAAPWRTGLYIRALENQYHAAKPQR